MDSLDVVAVRVADESAVGPVLGPEPRGVPLMPTSLERRAEDRVDVSSVCGGEGQVETRVTSPTARSSEREGVSVSLRQNSTTSAVSYPGRMSSAPSAATQNTRLAGKSEAKTPR